MEEELARIESTGLAWGPDAVHAHVASDDGRRAVIDFPETNWGGDPTLLVSAILAGEWADSAAFERCRLVAAIRRRGVIIAEAMDVDLYAAIDSATGRLRRAARESVRRMVGRDRKNRQRPGALLNV